MGLVFEIQLGADPRRHVNEARRARGRDLDVATCETWIMFLALMFRVPREQQPK
eukprot:CAMPEP_0194752508 /NCGR_PEP_ID=MMETSP0323_2-20130528/6303_1 /TAXON_ID=2866 ORGANISM="Crypthecodinium cohnii, Strain Seligo" /NCGR_SAMPLE_ID=MMETSP0323_2 /ASSEMBLY_ACC=CAM_ASM_000346 /LENGTH=53 /DNA_ID=CAMNT_0039669487 /DNA_START=176 /DNA_END=337 /DNA_ORIENTATION=-